MLAMLTRLWNRNGKPALLNGNPHSGGARMLARDAPSRQRARYVVTMAELAPCTCPDSCERDHGNE